MAGDKVGCLGVFQAKIGTGEADRWGRTGSEQGGDLRSQGSQGRGRRRTAIQRGEKERGR